jgi:hypothetical protein
VLKPKLTDAESKRAGGSGNSACWLVLTQPHTFSEVGHIEIGDTEGVVDFDSEVTHRALNLGMAEQQLDCSQISGAPIDQHCLCSAQGVRSKLRWTAPDTGHRFPNEPSILPSGQPVRVITAAGEQELTGGFAGQSQLIIYRLSRLLGQLEPD